MSWDDKSSLRRRTSRPGRLQLSLARESNAAQAAIGTGTLPAAGGSSPISHLFIFLLALLFICSLAARTFGQSTHAPRPVVLPDGKKPTGGEIRLGQKLFNFKGLSLDGSQSCATCHTDAHAGAEARPVSIGITGGVGIFNAPTVFDAVYPAVDGQAPLMFRNGREPNGLATQALQPIINPNEMGAQREEDVLAKIFSDKELHDDFESLYGAAAFTTTSRPIAQNVGRGRFSRTVVTGQTVINHVKRENYGRVMMAFESTLITPHNSDYDRYVGGNLRAMNPKAVVGMGLFFSAGCIDCHKPPLFKDSLPHNNGMIFASSGQLSATGFQNQRATMTGNLRRAYETPPYAPNGGFTLDRLIEHYSAGGQVLQGGRAVVDPLQDPSIRRHDWTPEAKECLIEFIKALRPQPGTSPKIEMVAQ